MNAIKSILSVFLLVCYFEIGIDSVCVEEEICQHNYGKRLKPNVPTVFIKSVNTPTRDTDPIPCCKLCVQTPGCDYYFLQFNNGSDAECSLYELDDSLKMDLLFGKLYITDYYPGFCIGYTNKYLGI
jgi:hypothetical protein